MGARTGEEVLQGLRERPAAIWHRGRRVDDITREPGLANGVHSLAALYDLQWKEPDLLLCDGVGRSFTIARTVEDLAAVGRALKRSADYSLGMMGREPTYLNRAISAFAGSAEFFGKPNAAFAENVRRYHAHVRDHDLSLTHTLLNPRPNRLVGPARQANPETAAHVREERGGGIVVRGARLLATLPTADELVLFPARLVEGGEEHLRYAFGLALPAATPGVRFICRDSVDYGFDRFDHPLGSRFEEMDAVVIFDDVFVPWERVFCYRDEEICNGAYLNTGAMAHMAHQVVCKNIAKTEYLLGLVSLMIDGSGLETFQHVQEKLAEIWINLEVLKAFRRTAEVDAEVSEYGAVNPAWDPLDAARNLYPRLYPRMIEIIQQIGASGLVAMPTLADLNGPLADDIKLYYQAARLEAIDRIPLYRLAWDTAVSAFGSRQVLYERFFFGDPVQNAGAIFKSKDRSVYMDRIRAFLKDPGQTA